MGEPFDIAEAEVEEGAVGGFGVGVEHAERGVGVGIAAVERVVDVAAEIDVAVEIDGIGCVAPDAIDIDAGLHSVGGEGLGDVVGDAEGVMRGDEREAAFDEEVGGLIDSAEGGVGNDTERIAGGIELRSFIADGVAEVALDLCGVHFIVGGAADEADGEFIDECGREDALIAEDAGFALIIEGLAHLRPVGTAGRGMPMAPSCTSEYWVKLPNRRLLELKL